jgi:hypothetical protein
VEALEQLRQLMARNAGAGVAHCKNYGLAGLMQSDLDPTPKSEL